ncbi:helix-turn-helix domain-containing protein [Propionimicrobium lymphophilum]|uniref:helix-turn-helix domain-containing protein n=1 Tax=Propionimicrobium lymphophilum TaxID=33012 RepID=UPI0035CF5091
MTAQPIDQQKRNFDTNDQLASEVRGVLAKFGLKQKDLATFLGIAQPNISKKLKGITPFTFDELDAMAEWFSTTPQVLMGFASEPRPQNPAYKEFLAADTARNSDSYTAWDSNPEPID